MKKRFLALILCLVMVIGLVPTVFAAQNDGLTLYFDPQNGQNLIIKPGDENVPRQGVQSVDGDQPAASEIREKTG